MSKTGIWRVLDIEPTADTAVIRRAYAARLKLTNPEVDPRGFMALREAYDAALSEARWRAYDSAYEEEEPEEEEQASTEASAGILSETPRETAVETAVETSVETSVETNIDARQPAYADPGNDRGNGSSDDDQDDYDFIPLPTLPQSSTFPASITPAPDAAPQPAPDESAALRRAFRLACTDLLSALNFNQSPAAIRAAFEAVIRSPAMDELGVHVSTEQWIANLIHQRRPASDCLIDRAIAYFGWTNQAASAHGDIGGGIIALRSWIAEEKTSDTFLARIARPAHEYHRAFVVTSKPMHPRPWWRRALALRHTGIVKRFLAHVDAVAPAAIRFLDLDAVNWWRTAIRRLKIPLQIVNYLWRAGAAFAVLYAIGSTPQRDDLVDARRKCSVVLPYESIARLNESACAHAVSLMPDSLMMRQYAGIEALRAGEDAAADAHFSAIVWVSPNDPYALFGQGLAQSHATDPVGRDLGVDMIATARTYEPEVDAYFARFKLTAPPTPTSPAPVIAPPYKRPTPPPAFDVAPKRHKGAPQDALGQALKDFGFEGSFDTGYTRLECLSRLDWSVSDCRIVAENPKNEGRAELALRIASRFQYEPATLKGEPVDYAPVNISIVFTPPDPARAPAPAAPRQDDRR